MTTKRPFLTPFLVMSGLGFLGILCLFPTVQKAAELIRGLPDAADLPASALAALLLVQPTVLLLLGTALGVALAEKAGLCSLILHRLRGEPVPTLKTTWGSTLVLALLFAAAAATADLLLREAFPAAFTTVPRLDHVTLSERLLGLLYGGITEELMMRFGLISLLVWAGLRLTGGRLRPLVVWSAILLSALAFAAAHLGVLAGASADAQAVLLARILGLNALLGALFGWLYARRSLEHAMLAHASSHVTFWIVTPLLARLLHGASPV